MPFISSVLQEVAFVVWFGLLPYVARCWGLYFRNLLLPDAHTSLTQLLAHAHGTHFSTHFSSKRFIAVTVGFIWRLSDNTKKQICRTDQMEIWPGKRWPLSIHLQQSLSIRRALHKQGIFAHTWTVSADDEWMRTFNFIRMKFTP